MKKSWGYHLIMDLRACNFYAIRNPQIIKQFSEKLVNDIDMVAYGPPQIVHFGENEKMGYTLVQLIETSNITAHFCEASNDAYVDVFSCKKFDPKLVEKLIYKTFCPLYLRTRFLYRDALIGKSKHDLIGRSKQTRLM